MATFDTNEALLSGFRADPAPKWKKLRPSMKHKRHEHAAVKLDEHRILVMGGRGGGGNELKSTKVYDTQTKQWESWPDLNEKRVGLAAALCNNKVYVFGGKHLDSIECLDLSSQPLQWKIMTARLSCERQGCTAALCGTDLYIIGGYNPSSRCLSSVDILDTTTDTIRQGPSMTTAREGCAAGVVDSTIYVVGGWDFNYNKLDTIEFLWIDTTEQDLEKWQKCNATMSTARWYPAVAVIGHCLVIMGGRDENWNRLSSVDVFDTRQNVCWRLPDMKLKRYGCAAVTLLNEESKVVVVGGYDGTRHASMERITLHSAEEERSCCQQQQMEEERRQREKEELEA